MEKQESTTFCKPHRLTVDLSTRFQQIDGFGANINGTCWEDGFAHVMDLLIDELGATLFRFFPYAPANWVDPNGEGDASVLNEETYRRVYTSNDFKKSWGMARYLNQRGIQPYVSTYGIPPRWMMDTEDGKTLIDYKSYAEMMVSLVEWAKKKEKIDFELFGPLNETYTGPPAEPLVSPEEFVKVMEVLTTALEDRGLKDIRLVAPEAWGEQDFILQLAKAEHLAKHIGVIATHEYEYDIPHPEYIPLEDNLKAVRESRSYAKTKFWLTEFGALDQSGEKEWHCSWSAIRILIKALNKGITGALVWDALDNYDKNEDDWTIYGIIRVGNKRYTPKKRFYALKQIYRFVPPGFCRVKCSLVPEGVLAVENELDMVAFASPETNDFSLIIMNPTPDEIYLNVILEGRDKDTKANSKPILFTEHDNLSRQQARKTSSRGSVPPGPIQVYRTTVEDNCARVARIPLWTHNPPFNGMDVCLKPQSITTVTTICD